MPTFCLPTQDGGVGFDYRLHMAIADKWIEILKYVHRNDLVSLMYCQLLARSIHRHILTSNLDPWLNLLIAWTLFISSNLGVLTFDARILMKVTFSIPDLENPWENLIFEWEASYCSRVKLSQKMIFSFV